tara:strand:- start:2968 stop:4020 length:1053 start_codon:yes stop_codon:yes gene_type:complete
MKSKNLSNKILKIIKSSGFNNIKLNPVIETKYILRRSGENFRKFLFSFQDSNGNELCLRPDLSISSVLRYLDNKSNKREKIFYKAEAYRKNYKKKDSIIKNQIGFEILGSNNKAKDDSEIINTSIKILKLSRYNKAILKIGNVELFYLLVDKLEMPQRWKQRLKRYYWNENYFNQLLKRLETNSDIDPVFVELDKSKYKKMIKKNQNLKVAGRSIKEILGRFDMKIKDPRTAQTGKKNSKIIKDFLKINCPIENAPTILNNFFKNNSLNIYVSNDYFPIKMQKNKKLLIKFLSSSDRDLEIYNSFMFSLDVKIKSKYYNFISGGRYDDLTFNLGFKKISAVGAAINLNLI